MLINKKFILASSSSSRYKILKTNKLNFIKINPSCDEEKFKRKLLVENTPIKKISLELARLKSRSVSLKNKKKLIVGCDTVIDFEGFIINKAKSLKDAEKKIAILSGKNHYIYSSASVYLNGLEVWKTTQKTKVKIRPLSRKEIKNYIFLVDKSILKCVGCYQAESFGPNIIEDIKGDFFNVLGFPLFPFLKFLIKYKV